jgi:MFS transporter, DHA2 family, multidrug resistance protein
VPQAFRGFSRQFAVAPVVTLTRGGLSADRLKLASGLFNRMRNLGGAIAASFNGGDPVHGHAIALRQLWVLTMREAQTQTYADTFLALMACLGLAAVMVPLMRRVAPPKAPVADAH